MWCLYNAKISLRDYLVILEVQNREIFEVQSPDENDKFGKKDWSKETEHM